ncbi:MAG TPA: tetratricopeptide repeat protein [Rhodocyclaceae bacterium]|nr:tetratricopeptide repeat protein [Rhodocyclaceae bacterium]
MAAYDLQEQEQLSAMKDWWEKNGNRITGLMFAIVLVLLGWMGWNRYQQSQASQASVLFGSLVQALDNKDTAAAHQLAGKLQSDFDGTMQANLGALLIAKTSIDANDIKSAQPQLEHVVAVAKDPLMRDVARLRLAAVLLDEKSYDQALKVLEATPHESFAARFADLRGDILYAKGSTADAISAYKEALDLLNKTSGPASPLKSVVETKLEALGG